MNEDILGSTSVDTYFGVMFQENGNLISLDRLKTLVSSGRSPDEYVISLRPNPDLWFYRRLAHAVYGRQDQTILSKISIPFVSGSFTLGKIDNSSIDISEMAQQNLLNPYMSSIGPRYGRNFEFNFIAAPPLAPNGFKLTFFLTDEIDPDNVPKSNIEPVVGQKTISYSTTNSEGGVYLSYSDMRWTLRNLIRLKSWYDVDMITATALPSIE